MVVPVMTVSEWDWHTEDWSCGVISMHCHSVLAGVDCFAVYECQFEQLFVVAFLIAVLSRTAGLLVECLPDDGMYFIVSPKDIVTARQRDEDDHISWLLEHEMFVVNLPRCSPVITSIPMFSVDDDKD